MEAVTDDDTGAVMAPRHLEMCPAGASPASVTQGTTGTTTCLAHQTIKGPP